ncbi:MAG TPA: hypothetical protein VK698_10225 [Kofleriaceae bacterium]|nr:hypothetical protein [Kofleriaceae bacterium]
MGWSDLGELLERFVLPLVSGGELVVGRPIAIDALGDLEAQIPHVTPQLVAVDEARTEVIAELVVRPPALVFEADELCLAACVHNLLFLVHPRADSWAVSTSARMRVLDTAQEMAARPLSQSRSRVLARHGLLHNLFRLTRMDTKISWWTGSATYLGQRPPGRLRTWRSVRRVREEQSVASYEDLLGTVEVAPVVTALLRRAPLTQLLAMTRDGPPLYWEDAVFLLRDAELARAVAYRSLRGSEPRQVVAAPARFAAAFEQMLERAPAESDVRAVAAFLVHLNALLVVGEAGDREIGPRSPLLSAVLSPERAGQRQRGLATFFSLPAALAQIDPRLGVPPGVATDALLADRWLRHRAQVVEGVGEAVIETLAGRLRRHLTAVLPEHVSM